MALDESVTTEMQRLQNEAALELCNVPLYKIDPRKIKVAFNNARSLHKHYKDVEFEPNVLATDVIGFAESRLCKRDENIHFALQRFRLIRLDEKEYASSSRPYHGIALYIKEYFGVQKVVKQQCPSCEFILASLQNTQKGNFQAVILYRYPKSSQIDFRNNICHNLKPAVDLSSKLVILGDFNIQVNCVTSVFVDFMETLFDCEQQIQQSTCDSGSLLDLIFANCRTFCDVIEAYWSDHKLIYCALEI